MNNCVCWNGRCDKNGYGKIYSGGRDRYAHRLAWEYAFGKIPNNLHVLHKCDNPSCIKLEHLFLGTQADNNADKTAKGRCKAAHGENHPSSKLTNEDVYDIRVSSSSCRKLAKIYSVDPALINKIKLRKVWKHLP